MRDTVQVVKALIVSTYLSASLYVGVVYASDSLLLKDGAVLTGEVIENVADAPQVVLYTGTKKINVARETIREISLDQNARAEHTRRAAALKAEDAKGHAELAEWCRAKGLFGRAETEWKVVLAADPRHAQARQALGLEMAAPEKPAASGDELFIVAAPPAAEAAEPDRKIAGLARVLGQKDAPEEATQEEIRGLLQEREKAGEVLMGCLDFRKHSEAQERLGALKGLRVVKPAGERPSILLAWTAVADPTPNVRTAAVDLIKERKDVPAIGVLIRHLIGAFDDQGNVVNAPVRDNAVTALRSVNDRCVAETLLYYCTMETRPTVTSVNVGEPTHITALSFYQTGGFVVGYWVSLPIYFPKVDVMRVRTTVCAPAAALRAVTGQDFGDDSKAWLKWIRAQQ